MGRSYTDVYQIGRNYKFGHYFYHAYRESNNIVYFRWIGTLLTAPKGMMKPKKTIIKRKQRSR